MANAGVPTRKLFKQYWQGGTEDLSEWRTRFVETMDPTEYTGAIELCGSWEEWLKFKKLWPLFNEQILPMWLAEIEVRLRSEAIRSVVKDVLTDSKSANSSAKWLAEGRFKAAKRGRASSQEREYLRKVEEGIMEEIEDDISRVTDMSDYK
jgi:hypothetical protein